ncbi:glycosyl hydrolase 108 family protein [Pelagibius litoralis]|nr:glycosyl hydrolase 108 family protein [Pelagibius litoralis]
MERSLAFGAEPVRDERGWALEVDFIEANGEAVEPWKHDRRHKSLYRRNQKVTKAAGQLIGQPGDKIEWAKRLAVLHHREGSDIEGAVRRGLFDAIWRYDHVYDGYTVPRRYGTHFMKTGRVAAVAEEQRRKWQIEGRAPADAFWVRNRRNTGLVLVRPNTDPAEELAFQGGGTDTVPGGDSQEVLVGQAAASPSIGATTTPGRVTSVPGSFQKLFEAYRLRLAPIEGGLANRPASVDPGGKTNKGLSQALLDLARKKPQYKSYPADPALLSDHQIDTIFREEYFRPLRIWELAQIPDLLKLAPQLPEQVFDSGILHGIGDPGKWLQQALDEILGTYLKVKIDGTFEYDGVIGPKTRAAVAKAVRDGKIVEVNNLIVDKRVAHMAALSIAGANPGWFPRAESFRIKPATP